MELVGDEEEEPGGERGTVRMVSMNPWIRMLRWVWIGRRDEEGRW